MLEEEKLCPVNDSCSKGVRVDVCVCARVWLEIDTICPYLWCGTWQPCPISQTDWGAGHSQLAPHELPSFSSSGLSQIVKLAAMHQSLASWPQRCD